MLKIEENVLLGKSMMNKCNKCVFCKKVDETSYCCASIEYCTNFNKFIEKEKSEIKAVEEIKNNIKPSYYHKGKIDTIKFCLENDLDFLQGNVVKYVVRYKEKNGIEDLNKAMEYLKRLIESENNK